jgi:hypothetical protein
MTTQLSFDPARSAVLSLDYQTAIVSIQWVISRERSEHNLLKSEEQNRNLLWLPLPIRDFSAHFKFPAAVTHVGNHRIQ